MKSSGMIDYSILKGVCVLRLNSPPLNTITFALLKELVAALERAKADPLVQGIVITGSSRHFTAGADLGIFREINCAEDAVRTSRIFQEAYQGVEDFPRPVVAAVAGNLMGGALELSMSCHYRISAEDARFSMPEVNFGINPGGGGTQRLPRLVGPERALKMLLTAETIDAGEARSLGLVDEVCDGDRMLDRAGELIRSGPEPRQTGRCAEKVNDAGIRAVAFRQADELISKVRPELIAPRKILEAVRAGLEDSIQAGFRKEQDGFAECMETPAARNKIHIFFATRETGKIRELTAAPAARMEKVAVIGMGSMGTGIAQALIQRGKAVVVLDEDQAALEGGLGRIRSSIEKRVKAGKLSPDGSAKMLGLLSTTRSWKDVAGVDLVIEAVYEDIKTKRSVLASIEEACAPDTLIASNTSTISLEVLAEGMAHPGRLMGMHFFNPAHAMPLVEIIRRDDSPEPILAAAMNFAKSIRKTPVLVRNREGFLVNRIFIPYLKEAFWLLEEGVAASDIDNAMVRFGFPMGPLTVIDMTGLDILVLTDAVLTRAFPAHGPLAPIAHRLVVDGHLGQKTGSGVYRYEKGSRTPLPRESDREPCEMSADEITRRLVLRMVSEASHVLAEGIARHEFDLDVAMVLGMGFPDFRGGLLRHARELGLGNVLTELEELAKRYGERFSPCAETEGA